MQVRPSPRLTPWAGRVLRAAGAIASCVMACGCHDQDKHVDSPSPSVAGGASSIAAPASSASASAGRDDNVRCLGVDEGCEVSMITDRAKSELEAMSGHEQTLVVFPHATLDAQLATVVRIPWVTRLRLQFTNKVTDLSPLSSLAGLKYLRIETAYASTLAPLRALSKLEELVIDDLPKLTDVDVAWLTGTTSLKHLELVGLDSVQDYGAIASLASLEELHLSVRGGARIAGLEKLGSLKTLHLDAPEQTDLTVVAGLAKLERLTLQGLTKVTDFAPLKTLPALRELELYRSSIKDLDPLAAVKSLTKLSLSVGCGSVTSLAPIASLAGLETLDVSGTAVKDLAPLSKLTKLVLVDVHGTAVTDLMPLARSKNLQRVIVSASVAEPAREALRKALPKVVIASYVTKSTTR